MSVFRVIVAHEGFRVGQVVDIAESARINKLVKSGYLQPAGPPDPVVMVVEEPKRRGRPKKVNDGQGETGSGGGEEVRVP